MFPQSPFKASQQNIKQQEDKNETKTGVLLWKQEDEPFDCETQSNGSNIILHIVISAAYQYVFFCQYWMIITLYIHFEWWQCMYDVKSPSLQDFPKNSKSKANTVNDTCADPLPHCLYKSFFCVNINDKRILISLIKYAFAACGKRAL